MTTKENIRSWLERAKQAEATHMLVVCDTFDHGDYPVIVLPGEDVRAIAKKNNGPNMTRLMEVYNMAMDIEAQIDERRAFHF